ncbi:hypothetical protein [Microbacterium sp. SORGH_AS_0421]|uniref:hypothetical protein n=1 Tax=Microbacterium sp. SORGH_AS_0421 TaxID=3041768 RepID=UPI00278D625B|nr:hypothetical protein [Microbacterium sp. SORGH_AS_0421]MDQ1177455.1 hypothetical protein [Microbacterium sp. SORGH_AS_0421]
MSQLERIDRILVVDDNAGVRETLTFPIEAAEREPVIRDTALGNIDEFLVQPRVADAAVSDYHLSPGNYANFDGATLVSRWYKAKFPAILCTQFDKANVAKFRVLRRWIPVVMRPDDLDQDSLMEGLELVQREFNDEFTPMRRPWRALVHFVEFAEEDNVANARVPGWSEEIVALRASDIPPPVRQRIAEASKRGDEFQCYATANLGAEDNNDLYLTGWETS